MKPTYLFELLNSSDKKGIEIQNRIQEIAKKYKKTNGEEIELNEPMELKSRKSNVYAFYVFKKNIYLLDDMGHDIDPMNVEVDFLEKFLTYVSNKVNLSIENSGLEPGEIYTTDGNGNISTKTIW
jgi:hypothetical protein